MEVQADKLLMNLEEEGQQIADCRRAAMELLRSGGEVDCEKMQYLCSKMNEHLTVFDQISEQLTVLENTLANVIELCQTLSVRVS